MATQNKVHPIHVIQVSDVGQNGGDQVEETESVKPPLPRGNKHPPSPPLEILPSLCRGKNSTTWQFSIAEIYKLVFAIGGLGNTILSYLSILSGPTLASLCGSLICLIPVHSALQYPSLWYEDVLWRSLAGIPVKFCVTLIRAEYMSNFTFKNRSFTYALLMSIEVGVTAAVLIVYYYLWTVYYSYTPPMPQNTHLAGSVAYLAVNAAIWSR